MLKPNKPIKILAIDPGSRYLAVAVFENYDLVYSAVKTIKGRTIQELLQKASEIIAELILTYQPDIVAQEKLHYIQCKTSEKLQRLTQQIKKVIQGMQVDYVEYPPTFVRQQICQQKKATKNKTFKVLAARYPTPTGKGGAVHQYFQRLIKLYAEKQGYTVEIEKHIGSQKTVDVSLKNSTEKVAVEVSVSTKADDELSNIQKCLSAGYDRIVVLCSKEKTADNLQKLVEQNFNDVERAKVFISPLNNLFRYLFRSS